MGVIFGPWCITCCISTRLFRLGCNGVYDTNLVSTILYADKHSSPRLTPVVMATVITEGGMINSTQICVATATGLILRDTVVKIVLLT